MVFEVERTAATATINAERTTLAILGASAVVCLSVPFFVNTDRIMTGMLLGAGTISAGLFGLSAQISESKEKIYQSLNKAELKALKQHLQGEAVYDNITTGIAAKRKVAAYINKLPVQERMRFMAEYGLQGLVVLPEPPAKPTAPRPGIPNPEIADIDETEVQEIVNPDVSANLQAIAQAYPKYIRLDPNWIDELCIAASHQNMSQRSNHHFYFAGGTQSGKSTLAGVLINKIAARSHGAAAVVGSDPKDGVTRWLCKFSRKFDGMETLGQWVTFATTLIDKRKEAIATGGTDPMPELFLVQDEVDSVYGGGKGFPGKVSKKQAEQLQALWNYMIKFTAGLKCHGIFMGQSPLSGATGFSRPELKNVCFIAMGQTASYILDNPKDFINVKAEVLQVLQHTCELLDEAGTRYALVVPTRSNPFVALIPEFEIAQMEQKPPQDTTKAEESVDWYEAIKEWADILGRRPTPDELKQAWNKLTGQQLNDKGVSLLMEHLGYTN
ncbi:MAG: hypothetical protein MET45_30100 [Nostoc sp. LLA-1]|nr:hypothetical protein [Cyanocohniella sp. LLY]